jgi:predicted PurR-regulated permease PerM
VLFAANAPRYASAIRDLLDSLGQTYRGLDLPPEIRGPIDSGIARLGEALANVDPAVLLPVATSLAALVGNIVGYAIIPVWAFYVLNDRAELRAGLYAFLPPSWRDEARAIAGIVSDVFGRWLRGQLLLSVVVGVVTFVGLLIVGALVDPIFARLAVLLAVIAGVLEFLPFIGPTLAAIPAALVGLTVSVEATVAVIGLYLVIQGLENYLIVPKVQSESVSLEPAIVIVALVIGATLAGFLGAILALPVTAAAKEIYEYLAAKLPDDPGVPATSDAPPAAGHPAKARPPRTRSATAGKEAETARSRR